MNARTVDHPPSLRRVGEWLGEMTDGELEALFAAAPELANRLRNQLDSYFVRAGTDRHPWSRDALLSLRPLVEAAPEGDGAVSRTHLLSMLDRVEADSTMSHGKLCRWLGWIQCALTSAGVTDLDTMKQHNFAASRAVEPPKYPG